MVGSCSESQFLDLLFLVGFLAVARFSCLSRFWACFIGDMGHFLMWVRFDLQRSSVSWVTAFAFAFTCSKIRRERNLGKLLERLRDCEDRIFCLLM